MIFVGVGCALGMAVYLIALVFHRILALPKIATSFNIG